MPLPQSYRVFRHTPASPLAICFDLDGVLIDTMPLHAKAWQETLKGLGVHVSRRDIYLWEGEQGTVTARTLLARRGSAPSKQAVHTLLKGKERRFSRLARGIKVNRRLATLLGHLVRRGVRLGLVTGTSRHEVQRVVPKRVLNCFDVIVTGDRVPRGKPHPDPYRVALRRLRVSPQRTVVVENAPYGIQSARRAGVKLVIALASSLPRRYLHEAHLVVGSVTQLAALLDALSVRPSRTG